MNCQEAKPRLLDYLLEEASAEERAEVQRHLESCETCTQEASQLQQTMGLLVRGGASEEIPQRIRLVAEPVGWRASLWRDSARLAFAGGGLACLAIALLALFRTTVSYSDGNLELAFGVRPALTASGPAPAPVELTAGVSGLDRGEILRLISEAVAASEARQQSNATRLIQTVAREVEQKRVADLREMAESVRYFQAAQTMMWKEQVQNQQLVSALVQQASLPPSGQP